MTKPGIAKGSGIGKAPTATGRKALGQRSASSANQILPKGNAQQRGVTAVVAKKEGTTAANKRSSVLAKPPAMLSRASTLTSATAPVMDMPKMNIFGSVPSQVRMKRRKEFYPAVRTQSKCMHVSLHPPLHSCPRAFFTHSATQHQLTKVATTATENLQVLYDERWQDKQERGLSSCVNFLLGNSPADESTTNNAGKSDPRACSAYRQLATRRTDVIMRGKFASLLQEPSLRCILAAVEREVKEGRLSIRPDRDCTSDLGLRDGLLLRLLSFEGAWLRPALEAVFAQAIPRSHASDRLLPHRV